MYIAKLKHTDTESKLVVTSGEREGELLCLKYISNKAVLHNTGIISHYLVITFKKYLFI